MADPRVLGVVTTLFSNWNRFNSSSKSTLPPVEDCTGDEVDDGRDKEECFVYTTFGLGVTETNN